MEMLFFRLPIAMDMVFRTMGLQKFLSKSFFFGFMISVGVKIVKSCISAGNIATFGYFKTNPTKTPSPSRSSSSSTSTNNSTAAPSSPP